MVVWGWVVYCFLVVVRFAGITINSVVYYIRCSDYSYYWLVASNDFVVRLRLFVVLVVSLLCVTCCCLLVDVLVVFQLRGFDFGSGLCFG